MAMTTGQQWLVAFSALKSVTVSKIMRDRAAAPA
jgi:hypothetical protein